VSGPADHSRCIDDHRDTGQYLAGESIDLLRELTKDHRRGGLFCCRTALHGNQRAEVRDKLRPCCVVLQGIDEPLELVDRDRRGLSR